MCNIHAIAFRLQHFKHHTDREKLSICQVTSLYGLTVMSGEFAGGSWSVSNFVCFIAESQVGKWTSYKLPV